MLDQGLHITTSSPAACLTRLCSDDVRGLLLEVVHGHDEGAVDAQGVSLRLETSVCGLVPKIRLVRKLAAALCSP